MPSMILIVMGISRASEIRRRIATSETLNAPTPILSLLAECRISAIVSMGVSWKRRENDGSGAGKSVLHKSATAFELLEHAKPTDQSKARDCERMRFSLMPQNPLCCFDSLRTKGVSGHAASLGVPILIRSLHY